MVLAEVRRSAALPTQALLTWAFPRCLHTSPVSVLPALTFFMSTSCLHSSPVYTLPDLLPFQEGQLLTFGLHCLLVHLLYHCLSGISQSKNGIPSLVTIVLFLCGDRCLWQRLAFCVSSVELASWLVMKYFNEWRQVPPLYLSILHSQIRIKEAGGSVLWRKEDLADWISRRKQKLFSPVLIHPAVN